VDAAGTEWMNASLLRPFAKRRRVMFVNRRSGLPRGMSMADLAQEHAEAIRSLGGGPLDVAGSLRPRDPPEPDPSTHADPRRSADRFYGPELFDETARLIPASRLRVFERRGHITVTMHPDWAREIEHFIAGGDQPA
jgi:hypothetical protein